MAGSAVITAKPGEPDYAKQQWSVWQQGATAAREGKKASDNPHSALRYEFVSWHNGWAAATHQIAKEDDEL